MSDKKYAHLVVTQDIRPSTPPAEGFLKRMQVQREASDYLDSFHLLSLNDSVASVALYYDAVLDDGPPWYPRCSGGNSAFS